MTHLNKNVILIVFHTRNRDVVSLLNSLELLFLEKSLNNKLNHRFMVVK